MNSPHLHSGSPQDFEILEDSEHEQIVFCKDLESGLRAIIAIHNTALGPSLGGCRMWNYGSEAEALTDALRLSRGMSYKSALAGLPLGGGKAVIWGDSKRDKSKAMFRAFGRFVESLNGRYITGEDVGTSMADMDVIFEETSYVVGVSPRLGGSGDPSRYTAYGCLQGIRASVKEQLNRDTLKGIRVAIQGIGHVGQNLARMLREQDAEVIAADLDTEKCRKFCDEFDCEPANAEEILFVDCDVLAPCAMGGAINDDTIDKLNCSIVAGSANNQLAAKRHGKALADKGILYAPDYAINSGGLINVSLELEGYNRDEAVCRVKRLYDVLSHIYKIARAEGIPTNEAADHVAEQRLENAKHQSRRVWLAREHPSFIHRNQERSLPGSQSQLDLFG